MKRIAQYLGFIGCLLMILSLATHAFPAVAHAFPAVPAFLVATGFGSVGAGVSLAVCLPIASITVDDCAPNAGGTVDLYVVRRRDILSWPALDVDNVTLAGPIVLKTGKQFQQWEHATDTGDVNHKAGGDEGNQSISVDQSVYIPKGSPAVDTVVTAALNGNYVVVSRDSNGFLRVLGDERRGMKFEHDFKSGKKGTDKNGYEMKFSGEGFSHTPYYLDEADLPAMLIPAV